VCRAHTRKAGQGHSFRAAPVASTTSVEDPGDPAMPPRAPRPRSVRTLEPTSWWLGAGSPCEFTFRYGTLLLRSRFSKAILMMSMNPTATEPTAAGDHSRNNSVVFVDDPFADNPRLVSGLGGSVTGGAPNRDVSEECSSWPEGFSSSDAFPLLRLGWPAAASEGRRWYRCPYWHAAFFAGQSQSGVACPC
jgi:hypothetical protein